MTLRETIDADLKRAMLEKNERVRDTLRGAKAELLLKEVELGRGVNDQEVIETFRRQIKSRKDAIEQFEAHGRPDAAADEKAEIAVLEGYLPKQLDEAETKAVIAALIAELGLEGKKDFGRLMKEEGASSQRGRQARLEARGQRAGGMNVAAWLRAQGASEDLARWAEPFGDDLCALWAACPRGDWLLAIAVRLGLEGPPITDAAIEVGRLSLDVLPEQDEAHRVIDDLGSVSEEARAAQADALEARSDGAPDAALATALLALSCVARSFADPSAAPMVAALSTQALVFDAQECGVMSVIGWAQSTAAERVRRAIPVASVLEAARAQGA